MRLLAATIFLLGNFAMATPVRTVALSTHTEDEIIHGSPKFQLDANESAVLATSQNVDNYLQGLAVPGVYTCDITYSENSIFSYGTPSNPRYVAMVYDINNCVRR